MVKMPLDEDHGHPIAKLSGSEHYLFQKGLIGTISKYPWEKGYSFNYNNAKEIHLPELIKYNENTKQYLYLKGHVVGLLYVAFLYFLYYQMTIQSIDVTQIPNLEFLGGILPTQFLIGMMIFAILLLSPDFYFEFRVKETDRHEKIRLQHKFAPYPYEYHVRHNRRVLDYLFGVHGYIWRLSIILSMITYRVSDLEGDSASYPLIAFVMFVSSWIGYKIITNDNVWIDISNKYPSTKILDIEEFHRQLLTEINNELLVDNTPIEELIGIGPGETENLEFKASYWTETKGDNIGQRNRCLEDAIVKEVAAFLNTKGGTLLIGINDNSPYNPTLTLEQDLGHSSSVNSIGDLELHIGQILENNLTCRESLNAVWRIRFPMYRGTQIIRIDIDKALEYVIAYQSHEQKKIKKDPKHQFHFWRQGSRSKEPSQQTWMEHIIDNWSK